MKDRSSVNSNYRLLKPASKKRPALAKLRYEPAPPRCKLTVAPGGGGAVERAGRLHFSFHPLYSAGPDLEVPRYSQHALLGPQLSLYTLLHGGIDDKMKEGRQAKLIWGPLRHGAGHNVAFYVYDYTGTIVEYSAEEEIILNDGNYVPRSWPVTDPCAADEWNRSHIPDAMM